MTEFPLKYASYRENITLEMLNDAYGEDGKGRTFKDLESANLYFYKLTKRGVAARIYKIMDYHAKDTEQVIDSTGKVIRWGPKEGAQKYLKAYLVSPLAS